MTNEDLRRKADEIIEDMIELGEYSRNFVRESMPTELHIEIQRRLEQKGNKVEVMAPHPGRYINISFRNIPDEGTDGQSGC